MTNDELLTRADALVAEWYGTPVAAIIRDLASALRNELARSRTLVNAAVVATERAERAEAALRQWETWGIAEIAVRNQSVMEYMEHWEGRAKRAEERLAVYNSGGFADADALAAKFIDLTRDRDKALRHVVRLKEAINRLHEVARGEHEASYHDICDIVNAAMSDDAAIRAMK